MQILLPAPELAILVGLFEKKLNTANVTLVVIGFHAYLDAVVTDTVQKVVPALVNAGHVRKLEALRELMVIDAAASQAATCFAHIRNALAHTFEEKTLSDSNVKPKLQTMLGLVNKHYRVDKPIQAVQAKVDQVALRRFGLSTGLHMGHSGDDGERLKWACFMICLHFLVVKHAVTPPSHKTVSFLEGYTFTEGR